MRTFFKRLFWGVILNSLSIFVCQKVLNYFLNDFFFRGTIIELIIFAFILTILNFLIKPILRLVFLPIIWLTLGLFTLIINLIILKTAAFLMPDVLIINSTLTWLLASMIISILNSFLHLIH
ncbi:MAG: phage holin family protein [Parcubacteria group bacterium]|nr:phage holin family protein [Parcubacteria group bacterium]